jgi:hypothetical protein
VRVGQTVLYRLSVPKGSSSAVTSGTVKFTSDGSPLPGCSADKFVGDTASCWDPSWPGGVYQVGATYAPSVSYVGAGSVGLQQQVYRSPNITSNGHAVTSVGGSLNFQVVAQGYPVPTFKEHGALPGGVTFSSAITSVNHDTVTLNKHLSF